MKRRAKKEDDYLGPTRGWAKVLHRTVMFILLPLRKPWWSLLVAIILFLAPTFAGVKPAEVHLWYWCHIKNLTTRTTAQIADKAQKVMPTMEDVNKVVETVTNTKLVDDEKANTPKIINQPRRQTRRKTFEIAKAAPKPMEISKEPVQTRAQDIPEPIVHNNTDLKLRYLPQPQLLNGTAEVINANELRVNGKVLFLYGIYVAPNSEKGLEGEAFLQKIIAEKNVECRINAYTFQNIPTAICFVNGVELNHEMVYRGYSKNVALD